MSVAPLALRTLLRRFLRSPGFTLVTAGTLALGIGASVAIFAVVHGVLLEPLPFPESDRLVHLGHVARSMEVADVPQSHGSYTLYRREGRHFEEVALFTGASVTLTGDGEPVRVEAAEVSESFFPVLGVGPALGRGFTEEEVRPGGGDVVVLSHGLWERRFGADPEILGRTIRLSSASFEVVGVMGPGFDFPDGETELWVPHVIDPESLSQINFSYQAIARLRPGATLEAAQADAERILSTLPEAFPGEMTSRMLEQAGMEPRVSTLREWIVGDVRTALWILLGTVGFVLLIACANVANLFLVRAEGRQREWAVRTALGSGRGDRARHFLIESVALAALAGAAGVALAWAGVRGLLALSPGTLPRASEIGLGPEVFLCAAGVSILAALLFGAAPILRLGGLDVVASLKEGGRGGSGGRETQRARSLLVAGQVALALVLLVGSGLLARTFWSLRSVDPGFDREGVLTMRTVLPRAEYEEASAAIGFQRALLDRVSALPGVEEAGVGRFRPLTDGESNSTVYVEEHPTPEGELPPVIRTNYAGPGWFEALGIPLLEGRTFEERDLDGSTKAAVVSRSFAERFWPRGSALGKRVIPGGLAPGGDDEWWTIVGVVDDIHDTSLTRPREAMVYWPMVGEATDDNSWVMRGISVAVRTAGRGDPGALAPAVRRAVWDADPALAITSVRTTGEIVDESMARTTFTVVLLGIAAAVALLLGTVGLYGVVAYVVGQRTREIGVRMALGAAGSEVRGMVVRQGLLVAVAGVAVGLLAAGVLTRFLESILFGVEVLDPLTYGGTALLLLGVAGAASWVPALRASRIDPMEALRTE